MIKIPGDDQLENPTGQSYGVFGTGGAEMYGAINGNSISVTNLNASAITAGTIDASVISVTHLNASNITSGTINASTINITNINASNITSGTINASLISVTNLSADNIVTGTLTVGSGGATSIYIKRSTAYSDAFLRWEGGTRIWSDGSNRLGINSIGSPAIIYVDSNQKIAIPSSGQTVFDGGVNSKGNFNVSDNYASHFTGEVRLDTNYIKLSASGDAKLLTVNDMGVTFFKDSVERGGLTWGNGAQLKVDKTGKWFMINGNAKEAVVPTSQGYKALYCVESPEVWFMDFCEKKDGEYQLDPLFKEVTKPPYRYLKTEEEGIYQVWGKRKGHEKKRFEERTKKQFQQNEKFLTLPKRM